MELFIIVMVAFVVKNALGVVNIFDIFADAGANQMILKPAVRAFDFSFGLRRERVDRFDGTVFDNHFPLRVDVVGKLLKTVVSLVTSFDITEYGMTVGVIG